MLKNFFSSALSFFRQLNQRSFIALMATVVSICALCVSLYQAKLLRKQQLASVWPYVSIGGTNTSYNLEQSWGIKLTNNGLGPAIIEKVEIKYAGSEMPFRVLKDSLYAQHSRLDSLKNLNYSIQEIERGTVIPANTSIEWLAFNLSFSERPKGVSAAKTHMKNLQLRVQYKSLYGERWESCFNCGDSVEEVRKLK